MRSRPGSAGSSPGELFYYAAVALPYLAVPTGLYLLHSAWAAVLGYQAGTVIFLTAARAWRPAVSPGRPAAAKVIVPLLAGCLISGALVLMLWPWAARYPGAGFSTLLTRWGVAPAGWPFLAAYLCLTTPWLEEIYWRAWLGGAGRHPAETPAWFAGYHLLVLAPIVRPGWLVLVFACLASAGWCWQRLLGSRNGLRWAVLTHLAADASVMLAATWLLRT